MDSNMATITKEKAAELTAKFGASEKDTGNVRVQIAILTEKIKNLTDAAVLSEFNQPLPGRSFAVKIRYIFR